MGDQRLRRGVPPALHQRPRPAGQGLDAVARATVRPIVIDEDFRWLGPMVAGEEPDRFWEEERDNVRKHPAAPPAAARRAIESVLPTPRPVCRFARRRAGLGSLGKPRYVGLAEWNGGPLLREAKALTPSACAWARGLAPDSRSYVRESLSSLVRSPDPWLLVRPGWIVRRLAPDCGKLDLEPLGDRAGELLSAMGAETANAHARGRSPARGILRDMRRRGSEWLRQDAQAMADALLRDWRIWCAEHRIP